MEDDKIVELFLSRDKRAIEYVSQKYGGRLRAAAYRITADEQTAEECENDTYLEAWNRIPPNEPREYLLPFLMKILRNISLNRCFERERQKRSALLVELTGEMEQCLSGSDTVENHIDGEILGETVSRFLHTQPKEKRLMFLYRYFYFYPISEIAGRLRVGESKVKTTLYRMRRDLRQYLIKEGYEL